MLRLAHGSTYVLDDCLGIAEDGNHCGSLMWCNKCLADMQQTALTAECDTSHLLCHHDAASALEDWNLKKATMQNQK